MASFEEQIKTARLKKYDGKRRDYSDPKLAGFLTEKEVSAYQENVLDMNIENWYELIKDCTFNTKFSAITEQDAKLFVDVYERIFRDKDPAEISAIDWKSLLNQDEKMHLEDLQNRIEDSLKDVVNKSGYAFVKTSSRSAKDAPLVSANFKSLYERYLNEFEDLEERKVENSQIICLLKAAFESLRVQHASEVIEMFIKSERIYQDMMLALKVPERFRENFVIREFVDIEVDMEFRGFVFNGKLNALSQYNFLMYSKNLHQNKDRVQKVILDYFNNTISSLFEKSGFLKNYVIDFAVFSMQKVLVIELNPFLETTDGALFSWQHERQLLEGQNGDFVFRITERCKPGAKAMLPQSIRNLMNDKNPV